MGVSKPGLKRGCETCLFRTTDFVHDTVDEEIIRCYCKARHTNVDAEAMSIDCDFWELNKDYKPPENEKKIHGI